MPDHHDAVSAAEKEDVFQLSKDACESSVCRKRADSVIGEPRSRKKQDTEILNGSTLGGVDYLGWVIDSEEVMPTAWRLAREEAQECEDSDECATTHKRTYGLVDPAFYSNLPFSPEDVSSGFDVDSEPLEGHEFWEFVMGAFEGGGGMSSVENRRRELGKLARTRDRSRRRDESDGEESDGEEGGSTDKGEGQGESEK